MKDERMLKQTETRTLNIPVIITGIFELTWKNARTNPEVLCQTREFLSVFYIYFQAHYL